MKSYTKPEIKIENFMLSESVAACSAEDGWVFRGNQDKVNCYMETGWSGYEDVKAFTTSGICNEVDAEGSCYTLWSDSSISAGYGSV